MYFSFSSNRWAGNCNCHFHWFVINVFATFLFIFHCMAYTQERSHHSFKTDLFYVMDALYICIRGLIDEMTISPFYIFETTLEEVGYGDGKFSLFWTKRSSSRCLAAQAIRYLKEKKGIKHTHRLLYHWDNHRTPQTELIIMDMSLTHKPNFSHNLSQEAPSNHWVL